MISLFIKNNYLRMLVYTFILLVYFTGSMIALTLYSIIIHTLVVLMSIELYVNNIEPIHVAHKCTIHVIIEAIIFLAILANGKHTYTFILTFFCAILTLLNIHFINGRYHNGGKY